MEAKSNVIDMTKRRQEQIGNRAPTPGEASPVVDMTERRNEILNAERRRVKRTILTEFVGAFVVVPQRGLVRVSLYDISENGLSFDMAQVAGRLKEGDEVAMRVYLNQQTYFGFFAQVITVRDFSEVSEEGLTRTGVHFVAGTINEQALHHFVKFIETVSASLRKDSGDVLVSNLLR